MPASETLAARVPHRTVLSRGTLAASRRTLVASRSTMAPFAALLIAVSLAATLVTSLAAAQDLTDLERKIVELVDEQAEASIRFLQEVVDVNSGTMNHAGVREVGRMFQAELEALGFESRWIDMPDGVNRAGHLFAERRGGTGEHVLLIGHLDTVFEEDSPFQRFERDGDMARGPGVEDMKGGDVVIVYALKALHAAGALEDTNITVALTGDEESPGSPIETSRRDLIAAGHEADVALGFEAGVGGTNTATVARRGSSGWTLRVAGTRGHSSQIFSSRMGAGAVFEAARILNAFYDEVRGEEYLTFNPGVILGGTDVEYDEALNRGSAFGKTNVIAQDLVVDGGLRFISEEQKTRTRARMQEIAARSHPGTRAEIRFEDMYPAMSPTEGNYALLETLDDVSRALGSGLIQPVDPGARGAADISFVAPYIDSLDGLGVVGAGGHTVEEVVDLTSLPVATRKAALLIHRLTHMPR